jgi:glycine/D-amino acid oxidase-like deaminating enzyme
MKPPRQRVAIVGSGMAGLVAGYLLANDKEERFEVEVLEMVSITCSPFSSFFFLIMNQGGLTRPARSPEPRLGELHAAARVLAPPLKQWNRNRNQDHERIQEREWVNNSNK